MEDKPALLVTNNRSAFTLYKLFDAHQALSAPQARRLKRQTAQCWRGNGLCSIIFILSLKGFEDSHISVCNSDFKELQL